jgi:hypothetical protein
MEAFRAARVKIASWRQLTNDLLKVAASSPACVAVPLECCKVMSYCNRLDYPLTVCSIGRVGSYGNLRHSNRTLDLSL